MFSVLINILLPVFLVAGIAAFAHTRLKLDIQSFSKAAFYIFSPALVMDALVNSDVSSAEFGQIAAALIFTSLILWAIGEVLVRGLGLDEATRAAFLVAIIICNSGNYGLPVNLFAFGEAGLARAVLYVTINSMLRSSLGVYLAARGNAGSLRAAFKKMLSVPVLYAAALGLLINLTGWELPASILKSASILGQGLVPASLLVLGVQVAHTLQQKRETTHIPALTALSVSRLILAPLIAYTVGRVLGMHRLALNVVVLESATPTAVMSLVLATEFKSNATFASLAILVTTLISLVTVTLWLTWLM